MPAPMKWESKIILAKIETTEGVDAAPTGAANAMLTVDASITPMEGEDISRNLDWPYLAAEATKASGLRTRMKFKVELQGSGTAGTPPAWDPLLRACGVSRVINAGVSVVYAPVSSPMDSVTLHFWVEGTRHVLLGARGTCMMKFTAQQLPYLEFDILGLYGDPAEVARPATVTLTGFQEPDIVSKTNTPVLTIDAVPLVMREFLLNLGNKVEPRLLVPTERIIITDRDDAVSARVEAVPLTTLNPYLKAKQSARAAIALTHGTVAGKIAAIAIPAAQYKRHAGYEVSQNLAEWPLAMTPLPVGGNDQWTLTLT